MVYCGKPSKACEQCKERKIKCSLKPNCRPCMKAGLRCSGPRNPNDLVFRDESLSVVQKETMKKLPKILQLSLDDRARGFFISHYVVGNSRAFDYIPPLLDRVAIDSHLSTSLDAVSLAHFYNKTQSLDILHKARQAYVNALQLTNAALQSSELSIKNETMLAVLLLDLFEKITNATTRSFKSWTQHINGALALAKLRGTDQFRDPVGMRMFIQLTSTIIISCVQRDAEPPAELLKLRNLASEYWDVKDPKWQYTTFVMEFLNLRIAIKEDSLTAKEFIEAARRIDEKFQSIIDTMPLAWKYETIITKYDHNTEDVYENNFHIYPDHRITHIWNNIRISRIIINDNIREQLELVLSSSNDKELLPNYLEEIQRSNETIASLAAEICASVPQYTRVRRLHKKDATSLSGVHQVLSESASAFPTFDDSTYQSSANPRFFYYPASENRDELYTPFEAARCYSLVFPLYIAARSPAAPECLREWVLKRLRFFDFAMGIREANMTAEVLEGRKNVNLWSVYATLGSYTFSA